MECTKQAPQFTYQRKANSGWQGNSGPNGEIKQYTVWAVIAVCMNVANHSANFH